VIFLGSADPREVDLEWLKSEWWKMPPEIQSRFSHLIEQPDLTNADENATRSAILRALRDAILRHIPGDARYRHAKIEETDLASLFIITSWDWFLDTGRTYALSETLIHLQPNRGGRVPALQRIDHRRSVDEKRRYLNDYDANSTDEHLIVVASGDGGPFTLIDGTHRAVALLVEHEQRPTFPWKAIVIDSPGMSANHWHIGFTGVTQKLAELGQLADQGSIW
jgi:hypothetical protein